MNRIRQIEGAEWPFIVPVEDRLKIVHGPAKFGGGWCVMVECPTLRNTSDVEEFVRQQTKQDWITPLSSRIQNEDALKNFTHGNPHMNGKGCWVWLFVRIEKGTHEVITT